ncbi:MAG: hypothetical protein GVY26_11900 [Bacteroidetes bacterium]|jgi:hypothetical protein|nr:hypothetical protein [Bacteroidota bacterium]
MTSSITPHTQLLAEVSQAAEQHFRPLSKEQLNWKPDPNKWSIAQCLDHLIRTNEGYLEQFEQIKSGQKRNSLWERMPLFPTLFGNFLLKAVDPANKQKVPAPSSFRPARSHFPPEVLDNFLAHNRSAIRSMEQLPADELRKYRLTSPASPVLTLRLDQAVELIPMHEQRHLQQALRVMEAEGFPASALG